jgi:hypothetical protein
LTLKIKTNVELLFGWMSHAYLVTKASPTGPKKLLCASLLVLRLGCLEAAVKIYHLFMRAAGSMIWAEKSLVDISRARERLAKVT